jgi:hypothetical protein
VLWLCARDHSSGADLNNSICGRFAGLNARSAATDSISINSEATAGWGWAAQKLWRSLAGAVRVVKSESFSHPAAVRRHWVATIGARNSDGGNSTQHASQPTIAAINAMPEIERTLIALQDSGLAPPAAEARPKSRVEKIPNWRCRAFTPGAEPRKAIAGPNPGAFQKIDPKQLPRSNFRRSPSVRIHSLPLSRGNIEVDRSPRALQQSNALKHRVNEKHEPVLSRHRFPSRRSLPGRFPAHAICKIP